MGDITNAETLRLLARRMKKDGLVFPQFRDKLIKDIPGIYTTEKWRKLITETWHNVLEEEDEIDVKKENSLICNNCGELKKNGVIKNKSDVIEEEAANLKILSFSSLRVPIIISIILLIIAPLDRWSDGYYQLVRIVVCITSGYATYIAYLVAKEKWAWVMLFITILFNPILKIHLERETWYIIDFIVAGIFLSKLISIRWTLDEILAGIIFFLKYVFIGILIFGSLFIMYRYPDLFY